MRYTVAVAWSPSTVTTWLHTQCRSPGVLSDAVLPTSASAASTGRGALRRDRDTVGREGGGEALAVARVGGVVVPGDQLLDRDDVVRDGHAAGTTSQRFRCQVGVARGTQERPPASA